MRLAEPGRIRYVTAAGHVLFWCAVVVFHTLYFGRGDAEYQESLTFVAWLLPVTVGTTYVLIGYLVPRYLLARKYGAFGLYASYTLILSADLELLISVWLLIVTAVSRGQPIRPVAFDVWGLLISQYVIVFAALATDLLSRWYRIQRVNARLEKARLEAEVKLKVAELTLLKAQLHPHFLFNTLNSLYALTLERSPYAPDMVLRLSDMLDYILRRGERQRVALAEEISHLTDYLKLEEMRYPDRARVRTSFSGVQESHVIAPLLLIPLVENAVKHGVSASPGRAWVDIALEVADGEMVFTVGNSITAQAAVGDSPGIGLANLRRRLELLYPDRHQLTVEKKADRFDVVLRLALENGEKP